MATQTPAPSTAPSAAPSVAPSTAVGTAVGTAPLVPRRSGGLTLHGWTALRGLPLDAWVTGRDTGNLALHVGDDADAVLARRARLATAAGWDPADAVYAEQTHGRSVAVVTRADRGRGSLGRDDAFPATDALVTRDPGVVLVVMVADCVPIVLYDPVRHALACVHAGWAGTVRGVTTAAVTALRDLGSDPADLVAGVGPSVAPSRYRVGTEVADAARAAFGDRADDLLLPDGDQQWRFDLWRAAAVQLASAGLRPDRIHVAGLDTGPGTPFFSHRSEAPTGRFALVARLKERS